MGRRKNQRDVGPRAPLQKAAPAAATTGARWRDVLLGNAALIAISPVLALIAGAYLVIGGIVLAIAWQLGAQPLLDYFDARPLTGRAPAHVVDAWAALEFDPAAMPPDKLYWQPYAKIAHCAVFEYGEDFGAPLQRAFCGNRFSFSDFFRLDDWHTLTPQVPFAFPRDANGFEVADVRIDKSAYAWLATHAPHSTFMAGEPKPRTALEALQREFDAPLAVAVASWSTPMPQVTMAFDPRHPEHALPATLVEHREYRIWGPTLGLFFAIAGIWAWRRGVAIFLVGQPSAVIWLLTLLPLLGLPWWNEVLPRIVRRVNADWAQVADMMLDDLTRLSRLIPSAPREAMLVDGERLVWRADRGLYAATFGRVHFHAPAAPLATPDGALAALRGQVAAEVARWTPDEQKHLFDELSRLHADGNRDVQPAFTLAAEQAVTAADEPVYRAARMFLVTAIPGHTLDAIDAERERAAASRRSPD